MRRRWLGVAILLMLAIVAVVTWPSTPTPPAVPDVPAPTSVPPTAPISAPAPAPDPTLLRSEAPPRTVTCPLPADVTEGGAAVVSDVPWLGGSRRHLQVRGGALAIPVENGRRPITAGSSVRQLEIDADGTRRTRSRRTVLAGEPITGSVDLPGSGRVSISLVVDEDGAWTCTVGALVRYAAVTGRVRLDDLADGGRVDVIGCGTQSPVDGDGGFFLEVPPEPCTLRASRRDGAFVVRGSAVQVKPGSGDEIVLDLDLPGWRAAGVGTQVADDPDGVRLDRIFPGTPAERAGLKAGDVVVALDGEDIVGIDVNDFVDLAVGPAGTDVTYTVLRDGEEVDVTMTRQEMAPPER